MDPSNSRQRDIDKLRHFIKQNWSNRQPYKQTITNNSYYIFPNGTINYYYRNLTSQSNSTMSLLRTTTPSLSSSQQNDQRTNIESPIHSSSNQFSYLETKHWLDLMTLTVDGMVFFVNLILSCYMIYRICNIINHHSNDVLNSLLLHKALIGLLIGFGLTFFDIFLIFSTANHPLYRTIMRKIPISISWSSLCFLKLNFKEIMTTCFMYYIIIILIVLTKLNIIPANMNRQWKIFLAFLHGIPWIIVFLVQLLLYIVSTFQINTTQQRYRRTNCNFLLRENFFSLFFETLLITFPTIFCVILIIYSSVKYCPNLTCSYSNSSSMLLNDDMLVIPTDTVTNSPTDNFTSTTNNPKQIDIKFDKLQHNLQPNDLLTTLPTTSTANIASSILNINTNNTGYHGSNMSNNNLQVYTPDKTLILAISLLLICCKLPSLITRLIMNFYWIFKYPTDRLNFVYCICAFIGLCFYALQSLLVLIYLAWKDGINSSSLRSNIINNNQNTGSSNQSSNINITNNDCHDRIPNSSSHYSITTTLCNSRTLLGNFNTYTSVQSTENNDDVIVDTANQKFLMSSV